ncbi:MAG: penicillin-binding protein activator [Gammaproteobacteria bacterium]
MPFHSQCSIRRARHDLFVSLTVLLAMTGCATAPEPQRKPAPSTESGVITKPLITADRIITSSEFDPSGAPSMSRELIRHRLGVIEALIQTGDFEQAKAQAESLDLAQLSDQERSQLHLLHAQLSLSVGEAEQALDHIKQIQPELLNPNQKINFLKARAFAFSLLGNLLESAQSRIELSPLLTSPESLRQNQRAILETLSLLQDHDPENSLQTGSDTLSGWIELAGLYKQKAQPDFVDRLNQWRAAFPDHPADLTILGKKTDSSDNSIFYPGSIAVLLPGTGPFAEAGNAVKAGLMAAFANLKDAPYKPNLQFYDTTETVPAELYRQAVASGAEFMIGPLEKKDIQSLADSTFLDIPVLALNHIQNLEQDNLYQFALSPMDDVEQIAQKARLDGHRKALLMLPENSQTQRVIDYFKTYWQGSGGILSKVQTYHPGTVDFSSAVRLLLNRSSSQTGSLEQSPDNETDSIAQDADVIFIGAYSAEARAIKRQIDALGAKELAVYALPNIYSGQADPAEDQILNGISFCDMPWLINGGNQGSLGMSSLASVWRQFPNSYLRLIAMGIDAFNLSGRLTDLGIRPYLGATGKLSLAEDNRIKRDLMCARFNDGRPRVTDHINRSSGSDTYDHPPPGETFGNSPRQPEQAAPQ